MKIQIILFGIIAAFGLVACEENEKEMFAPEKTALNIWFGGKNVDQRVDSSVYNYAYRALDCERDSVMFYVRLAGIPSKVDRTFELQVVEEDVEQVVAGKHYTLRTYVLKAGSTGGYYPIYLNETTDFKDKAYCVKLALKEGMGFERGAKEYVALKLIVKDREEKPPFWDEDPMTYQPLKNFFGTYSRTKYRFMIQVTGIAITRVYYQGTPTLPTEITYYEAIYMRDKCRLALEVYNKDPENPDRPLADENGLITF